MTTITNTNRTVAKDDETNTVDEDDLPSRIRYIETYDETTGERRLQRQGHLMVLLPLSQVESDTHVRALQEFRVYVELSAFLAFKHIQERQGTVLPALPDRLRQCDFTFTYRHHDTQFSPLQAVRELLTYENNNNQRQRPITTSSAAISSVNSNGYAGGGSTVTTYNGNNGGNSSDNPRTPPPRQMDPPLRTAVPLRTVPPWNMPPRYYDNQNNNNNNNNNSNSQGRKKRKLQSTPNNIQQQPEQHLPPQKPFAVLGAARSVVSMAVSVLGAVYELPQISSSSTDSRLDDSPFFARTVPTNNGDAHACIFYLSRQLGITHVGVLFIEDSWGRQYEQDLQFYADKYGMTVRSVAYTSQDDLDQAMHQLKQSNLRYFIGIINPSAWKPVVRKAHEYGLMGHPDHVWMIGDIVELGGDGFTLDRETEYDIALALHGTGIVFLQVMSHPAFDQALSEVAFNPELQQEFIARHSEPDLLVNLTFSPDPGMSLFQYLTYDAVVALAITACETPGLFTGQEFYDQLLKVDFEGVSGRVLLNNTTGARLADSLQYQVKNLVLNDFINPLNISNETISFSASISSSIELSPFQKVTHLSLQPEPLIYSVQPFVYYDNTPIPPLGLPVLEVEMNLIGDSLLYFGLGMGIVTMLLSIIFGAWVLMNQKLYVVKASQPIFLVQLCVGTFVTALAIIPLGWQEPKPGLDAACMSIPWILSLGFTGAISALFSKARRINQLLNSGTGFRRVRVKPRDVVKPCLILMSVNVVLLIAWTASPWRMSWHRITVDNHVDQFGRSIESFGVCRPNGKLHFLFSTPLVLTNAVVLAMATYQSYRARDLPSELSETLYLSLSLVSLSETFLLGIIVIFAVIDNPPSFYLVSCVVICLGCLSILLPVFIPKYYQRNMREPRGRMSTSLVSIRPGAGRLNGSGFGSGASLGGGSSLHQATNSVFSSAGSSSARGHKRKGSSGVIPPFSAIIKSKGHVRQGSSGVFSAFSAGSSRQHIRNGSSGALPFFDAGLNQQGKDGGGPRGSISLDQPASDRSKIAKPLPPLISQGDFSSSSEQSFGQ